MYLRETELLCSRISDAYWNLYAVSMNRLAGESSLTRARELLETNKKRLDDGLLDETAVLAAEALISAREVNVLALRDGVQNAMDYLRLTVQIPRAKWEDAVFALPGSDDVRRLTEPAAQVNVATAITRALRGRPDLLALRDLAGLSETDLFMKRSSARPDLQLIGAVTQGSSGSDLGDSFELDDTSWTVGVQLEIPLLRRAERSAMRQSAIEFNKASNNVKSLESAIVLECRAGARSVTTAYLRVLATSKAAGLQRKKLVLEEKKFMQGRSATHLVIQYQNDLTTAIMGMHIAMAEYQKALVGYRLAQGLMPVKLRGPYSVPTTPPRAGVGTTKGKQRSGVPVMRRGRQGAAVRK
jgi:outer membrane protein TolC